MNTIRLRKALQQRRDQAFPFRHVKMLEKSDHRLTNEAAPMALAFTRGAAIGAKVFLLLFLQKKKLLLKTY